MVLTGMARHVYKKSSHCREPTDLHMWLVSSKRHTAENTHFLVKDELSQLQQHVTKLSHQEGIKDILAKVVHLFGNATCPMTLSNEGTTNERSTCPVYYEIQRKLDR